MNKSLRHTQTKEFWDSLADKIVKQTEFLLGLLKKENNTREEDLLLKGKLEGVEIVLRLMKKADKELDEKSAVVQRTPQ